MAWVVQHRHMTTSQRTAYTPLVGELIWDTDLTAIFMGDGTTAGGLNQTAPKYIIGAFMPGVLSGSQLLLLHRVAKAITFPANFGTYLGHASQAGGSANATGSTVVTVDQALTGSPLSFSNIGTITFGAGTITPTFATSGGTTKSFAQGDVLRIQAPGSADASFAGFYATLVAYES